jgi:hypothetical protein
MSTLRTDLARRHARVIENAEGVPNVNPVRLRGIAIDALLRKYDETGDLNYYLDMEDFHYGKKA